MPLFEGWRCRVPTRPPWRSASTCAAGFAFGHSVVWSVLLPAQVLPVLFIRSSWAGRSSRRGSPVTAASTTSCNGPATPPAHGLFRRSDHLLLCLVRGRRNDIVATQFHVSQSRHLRLACGLHRAAGDRLRRHQACVLGAAAAIRRANRPRLRNGHHRPGIRWTVPRGRGTADHGARPMPCQPLPASRGTPPVRCHRSGGA